MSVWWVMTHDAYSLQLALYASVLPLPYVKNPTIKDLAPTGMDLVKP